MVFRKAWFWPFAILSILVALMSLQVLFIPLQDAMPHVMHYVPVVHEPLWIHLIFGPLALLLAPLQLWTGLRRRRPALHRLSGYTYTLSVLVAGIASLMMLPHFQGIPSAAAGFALLGTAWIGATCIGISRAIAGDTRRHRQWMLRSIALTFAAVTLRLYMIPLIATGWTVTETYTYTAWLCWVPNLILAEIWLRRRGFRLA